MKNPFLIYILIVGLPLLNMGQNVPNGDFEIWTFNGNGMPQPQYWETQNEPELIYVESMPGNSGNHAACLNVLWDNMLKKYCGASLNTSFNLTELIKYTSLTGFLKGSQENIDSLFIEIRLFNNAELIGRGETKVLDNNNIWNQFQIPVFYLNDLIPDSAKITIFVNPETGNHFLTTYCLDDLELSNGKNKK